MTEALSAAERAAMDARTEAELAGAATTGTGGTTDTTGTTIEPTTDFQAEAEKWKELARKHEDRAKANSTAAKELADLKAASMSDQEKAVDLARTEARSETLREVGSKIVDAEIRAAAAGRDVDVDALLESLDRSKFIDDEGEPDRDAITAWIDRVAPAREEQAPGFPDLGQGTRAGNDPNIALNGNPVYEKLKAAVGAR